MSTDPAREPVAHVSRLGPPPCRWINWLVLTCNGLTLLVELALHEPASIGRRHLWGGRALGSQLAALMFVPMYVACWPREDVGPGVLLFQFASMLLLLFAHVRAGIGLLCRTERPYTYYTGRPRLLPYAGRLGEYAIKAHVEPVIVCIAGWVAMTVDRPLGVLWLICGAACFMSIHASGFNRVRAIDADELQVEIYALKTRMNLQTAHGGDSTGSDDVRDLGLAAHGQRSQD